MNSWWASLGIEQSTKGVIVQHFVVKLINKSPYYHMVGLVEYQADTSVTLYLGVC